MTAQPKPRMTEAEYLVFERASTVKHEYYNGHIYAMTGASEQHNLITANVLASLHGQLRRKPCRVYPSDMRLRVQQTGLNTYPDVVVVCGQPQFTDDTIDTLTNPTVIVEVLSPSTERYDRGVKFQNYRTITTLRDYVLIEQDNHYIEHYMRQDNGQWLLREAIGLEAQVTLSSIDCALTLNSVKLSPGDFEG